MSTIAETCITAHCLRKAQDGTDFFIAGFLPPPYHTPPPPPKVSTAPEISPCTIANPENVYVLINGVLRYVVCLFQVLILILSIQP